jgi:hypothetical protein
MTDTADGNGVILFALYFRDYEMSHWGTLKLE